MHIFERSIQCNQNLKTTCVLSSLEEWSNQDCCKQKPQYQLLCACFYFMSILYLLQLQKSFIYTNLFLSQTLSAEVELTDYYLKPHQVSFSLLCCDYLLCFIQLCISDSTYSSLHNIFNIYSLVFSGTLKWTIYYIFM